MILEKSSHPVLFFENLDSTNEEAFRQIAAGLYGPLWIVAGQQSQGRGRAGRQWQSPKGNLYASLLFRPGVSASVATQLPFVAGLSVYDAISSQLAGVQRSGLRLKWPNDVMLDGAKIAGILIESLSSKDGNGLAAIVGIGINVSAAPDSIGRPVTSLGSGPEACAAVFSALAEALDAWLARWDEGRGFAAVRENWLARAHDPGEAISVRLNGSLFQGRFSGINPAGGLLLETASGLVITVTAGDISIDAPA